jgi:hypothetical protein
MPDEITGKPVQREKTNDQISPPPPTPATSQLLKTPAHGEPTPTPAQPVRSKPQQASLTDLEEKIGRVDRWMIRLTAAIAMFTLALVVVGGFQWNAMRGQLKEMHDGGVDTHDLAVANLASTRAWLVVRATKFGYLKDKSGKERVSSIVEITDTAPTPAMNIRGWRCAHVLRKPPEVATTMPSEYPQDCVSETNGMIGKDIPIILHANDLSETVPPNSLSNDSHDFTAKHFYAWGYYTYEVAFEGKEKRHYMQFCLVNSDEQLAPCPEGNDGN